MFPSRENTTVTSNDTTKNMLYDEDICEVSSTNDLLEDEYPDIDDLDISLLCPDIILELDDDPIIINDNPVQYTKIHCTACNEHLGSALSDRGNRFVHPLLKVMICSECYEFYLSGEFEKDEDGSEIHCRWCGQGGKVLCCSKCEFVFCTSCIRMNLGRNKLEKIKRNENWVCFKCDPSQIAELKAHCAEFMEYFKKETSRVALLATASDLMKIDYSQCCLKTENASDDKKKLRPKNLGDRSNDLYTAKNLPNSLSSRIETSTKTKPKLKQNNVASATKNPIRILPKPVLSPVSIAPSNFYGQLQRQVPSDLTTNNNVVHASKNNQVYSTMGKTITTPSTDPENFHRKKLFYQNAMRSAYRINTDLFCDLAMVRDKKPSVADLEAATSVHNALQDLLNKSVRSLMQLQGELVECKTDHSETKFSNNNAVKKISFKNFGNTRI